MSIFFPEYRGHLTEGVTYNRSNNTLLWVDIIQAEVHRVVLNDPPTNHQTIKLEASEESIGAIGLTQDDDVIIICAKYGVAKGNFSTGDISYFLKYPENKRLRSNDGTIDPWGNLWIGRMTDFPEGDVQPEGKLYHINSKDLTITDMLPNEELFIPNGLAFNGNKFYWTDSLRFTIWSFDYDHVTNKLSNRQVHSKTKELFPGANSPEPDGFSMTNDAHIYGAVFSTSTVVHLDDTGKLIEKFEFPSSRITCTAIGGENDDELYVTTCNENLKGEVNHGGTDLGGHLFRVKLAKKANGQVSNLWQA